MKLADVWAAIGGAGVVSTIGAAWITLRANSRRDEEARADKALAAADAREVQSLGGWQALAASLREERGDLLTRVDLLQGAVDDLRKRVQDLTDELGKERGRREQLEGELRQEKQIVASYRSVNRRAETRGQDQ